MSNNKRSLRTAKHAATPFHAPKRPDASLGSNADVVPLEINAAPGKAVSGFVAVLEDTAPVPAPEVEPVITGGPQIMMAPDKDRHEFAGSDGHIYVLESHDTALVPAPAVRPALLAGWKIVMEA